MPPQYNKKIFDAFDNNVLQMVVLAKAACIDARVDCIYQEAFMIGILNSGKNEVTKILVDMDIDLDILLKKFKADLIIKRTKSEKVNYNNLKISKQIIDVCKSADKMCSEDDSTVITLNYMFVALYSECEDVKSVLNENGFEIDEYMKRADTGKVLATEGTPKTESNKKNNKEKKSSLDRFCVNVTELASQDKLDPIISRENEIESAITILCRRNKNNPILLGDAGVGKTAIVEGIAQRIVAGTVPKNIMNCKIYSLNMNSLVAGTKYRGEFEERLQDLVKEIQKATDIILFIDEMHTIVGAGSASGGALDASNILKPFLARNDLKCIGATTLSDYKKHIQKDGALSRRFQSVMVEEPTIEQMHKILDGIKGKLQDYHKCTISSDAIEASIVFSKRYLPNRNFPDKAIDCLDTACAKCAWQGSESKRKINKNDILQVVAEMCQMPIDVLTGESIEKVKSVEKILSDNIFGQNQAIESVCRVLKSAYSGIRNPDRPIGCFVFGGQSGTGKTFLAQQIAKSIFGEKSSIVKIDMTEYSESHSVSKLIGSPPGYIGFNETNEFIDVIKRKPYCVVLLDEVEKAHSDVMKLFFQVMADGTMTDSTGAKTNFKNTIIIMTGNFGMNENIKASMGFSNDNLDNAEQGRLIKYCNDKYGAEFVNRVDEFVAFNPLNDKELKKIISRNFEELQDRTKDRKIKISFDEDVYDILINTSKKEYGMNASILKRIISKKIEPLLSEAILLLEQKSGKIAIGVKNGELFYSIEKK